MCCVTPASARAHDLQCASECTSAYSHVRVLCTCGVMRMCYAEHICVRKVKAHECCTYRAPCCICSAKVRSQIGCSDGGGALSNGEIPRVSFRGRLDGEFPPKGWCGVKRGFSVLGYPLPTCEGRHVHMCDDFMRAVP